MPIETNVPHWPLVLGDNVRGGGILSSCKCVSVIIKAAENRFLLS